MTEFDRGTAGAPADSVDWDAVYAGSEQVWSGDPNSVLVAEVSEVTPGTAVDVGCGEGADVIWLAQRCCRATRTPPATHWEVQVDEERPGT